MLRGSWWNRRIRLLLDMATSTMRRKNLEGCPNWNWNWNWIVVVVVVAVVQTRKISCDCGDVVSSFVFCHIHHREP